MNIVLTSYDDLTEFQKWLFFYLAKNDSVRANMHGVMPGMCTGLKMKIDLENFDEEESKFRAQANDLFNQGLFVITTTQQSEYLLSDKGELYVLQKIIGPIILAKDNKMADKIIEYFDQKEPDLKNNLILMLTTIEKIISWVLLRNYLDLQLKISCLG